MKQSVTISGLGVEGFDQAVQGVQNIYQRMQAQVTSRGFCLRDWIPRKEGGHLMLTFSSRYLTSSRDAEGEVPLGMEDVDPSNILHPLLLNRTEVHVADNVVEFWERTSNNSSK